MTRNALDGIELLILAGSILAILLFYDHVRAVVEGIVNPLLRALGG